MELKNGYCSHILLTLLSTIKLLPRFEHIEMQQGMADVILGMLRLRSLVVNSEPVAACFGFGTTAACVAHLGHSVTRIICVEEGALLPSTQRVLPIGELLADNGPSDVNEFC